MNIIQGTGEIPVIFTAHHASSDFGEFTPRVALTPEQQLRFSDYGTRETVPGIGLASLIATRSRGLSDLNRSPDDPKRFQDFDFGRPERHAVWLPGQELTEEEKRSCDQTIHRPFHHAIIDLLRHRHDPTFVIAWDNTAHYEIGAYRSGASVMMPPFILSNRGDEENADGENEITSCDPEFLRILADTLAPELSQRGFPAEIHLNLVYRGGYITQTYSSRRHKIELAQQGVRCDVQSLQIEHDSSLTHDPQTLTPNVEKMTLLKAAFSAALSSAFQQYQHI